MPSGRINMQFTGETARASAHIRRLQDDMRKLKDQMRGMQQTGAEQARKTDSSLTQWVKGLSAVAIGYQALNRIISIGNQALERRAQLQLGNVDIAMRIADAEAQLWFNMGDTTRKARDDMTTFVKDQAKIFNMEPDKALMFMSGVASATRGNQEIMRKTFRAAGPIARFYEDPKMLGVLIGDLISEGFGPTEARNTVLQMQSLAHTTDMPQLIHALRGMASGLAVAGTKDPERRKEIMRQEMALYAAISHKLKDVGGEVSATAAAGTILTAFKEETQAVKGKTPMEIMEYMRTSGAAQRLANDIQKIYGKAAMKPALVEMFMGGDLYDEWLRDLDTLKKDNKQGWQDLMDDTRYGVGRHTEALTSQMAKGAQAQEELSRASNAAGDAALAAMNRYGNTVQTLRGSLGEMYWNWTEGALRGAPHTPEQARQAFLRRVGYGLGMEHETAKTVPWLGAIWPIMNLGLIRHHGRVSQGHLYDRYRRGQEIIPEGYLTGPEGEARRAQIRAVMDAIDLWEESNRRRGEGNASPAASPTAAPMATSLGTNVALGLWPAYGMARAVVHAATATQQLFRHTEPD